MLANDDAVESIVFREDGIIDSLPVGATHISSSTISVALSERLAAAHAKAGQRFIGAPVFGPDGEVTLGLFLIGFAGGMPAERVPEYASRLLAACERVTKGIQGRAPESA